MSRRVLPSGIAIMIGAAVLALPQRPEITGYSRDGVLTFTSPGEGKSFTLEFSGSPGGPWTNRGAVTNQPISKEMTCAHSIRLPTLQSES